MPASMLNFYIVNAYIGLEEMMKINFKSYQGHATGYVIKVVYPKNYQLITETLVHGYAQVLPNKKSITEQHIFDIASLTKFFTAIIVHRTIEKGLLNLNDPIKKIDERFVYLDDITIGNLLAHQHELWTDGYLGDAKNKTEFYQMLFNTKLKNKIRAYVDAHYMILSIILEKVYQKDFATIVKQEIIDVLSLTNTGFKLHANDLYVSCNYETVKGKLIDNIWPGTVHDPKARVASEFGLYLGHAGLFSTTEDLLKVLVSLIDEQYLLLSKVSIANMLAHDDATADIKQLLKDYADEMGIKLSFTQDINAMFEAIVKSNVNLDSFNNLSIRPYNYGGTRYPNPFLAKNEIPLEASNNTVIFSGYTGPIFLIDFTKQIVILVMCNVCHTSTKNRQERYALSQKLIHELYAYVLSKMVADAN